MKARSTLIDAIEASFVRPPDADVEETWLTSGCGLIFEELQDFYGESLSEGLWAVALLLCSLAKGGTCLDFAALGDLPELRRLPEHLRIWSASQWSGAFSCVTPSKKVQPLILSGTRLYFDRYFVLEARTAQLLSRELATGAPMAPADWTDRVNSVFGSDESNRQRRAALDFWSSRTFIIAGGPGTGKTTTVARTLVALAPEISNEATPFRVKLCAPTGKAAQRMTSALVRAAAEMGQTAVMDAILQQAEPITIHRLLGITPINMRRRSTNPLPADLVIVDETSMVDIALLSELLQSLSDTARLIVVGDPHQLQSVDVGSTMGDIVVAMTRGYLSGVELDVVHRVAGSGRADLLDFFATLKARDADGVESWIDGRSSVISFIDVSESGEPAIETTDAWANVLSRGRELVSLARDTPLNSEAIFAASTSVMVLTAQHQGPLSRTWWTRKVADALHLRIGTNPDVPGFPVLVTQSNRDSNLTNGDDGVVCLVDDYPVVIKSDQERTHVNPGSIEHWQPWWAMTIHKSQGSEFDHVIVSLTPGTSLISRELLYTAVTRARLSVTIIGTRKDLRVAVEKETKRASGLAEQIELLIEERHSSDAVH